MEIVMKKYNLVKNELLNNILLYMLIFFTIILSRDTLITSVKIGFYKTFFLYVIIIFSLGLLMIMSNYGKIKIKKRATTSIGGFIALLAITSLIKLDFQTYVLSIIMYIIAAYLFIYLFTFEDFFKKFSNVMVLLSSFSLVTCYAIRSIIFQDGVINNNISIIYNSTGLKFFDFGLSYVVALPYYIRNFGLFREPGVYQFFLLIPLIYELLLRKVKLRYFNLTVIIITLISTFSLAGLGIMGLIIIIFIIKLILDKKITRKITLILSIIGVSFIFSLIVLYFKNDNFYWIVRESIKKLFTVNDSTSSRLKSIFNNISLFIRSPLWGNDFALVQYASEHNTNTTISVFAIFGIFTGALHVWFQYLFAKMISDRNTIKLLMLIALILMINSQFLLGNSGFWIFTFSIFMIGEDEVNEENQWDMKAFLLRCGSFIKGKLAIFKR
jgi:hypothetical protein